jgi:hypothetical protein
VGSMRSGSGQLTASVPLSVPAQLFGVNGRRSCCDPISGAPRNHSAHCTGCAEVNAGSRVPRGWRRCCR